MDESFKCIGKAFQADGQAYEKPRGPIVFVRVFGITRSPLAADRSCIRPGTAATGTHSSVRYDHGKATNMKRICKEYATEKERLCHGVYGSFS